MSMSLARAVRILLALAALLIVVWAFFDVGARIANRATRGKIELTIMHWGDPDEDAILENLKRKFEAEHPNIRINRINAGGEFTAKLKTMFAAGTPPDLFYLGVDQVSELAGLKLLRPLDDYIAKEVAAGNQKWLDDFYPVLFEAYKYDGQHVGNGPLYGLPKDFTTAVMYVNLDLFAKAGVPVPYDGWTWDEFEAASKQITALRDLPEFKKDNREIFGSYFDIWPASLLNIIWNFGGDYFDNGDFRKPTVTSANTQRALEMIRRVRLVDRTSFNVTGIAKEGGQEFFTGNIGMLGTIGRWRCPQFRAITAFKWNVVPVPTAPGVKPASQIFTTAWTMSASTKHSDEAYALMKFLTGPDGQRIGSKLGLAIPSLKSVANSDAFLDPDTLPDHDEVFLRAVAGARLQQTPQNLQEFNRIVQDGTDACIKTGRVDCATAGRTINQQWIALLDSPLKSGTFPAMNWTIIGFIVFAVVAAAGLALWFKAKREKIGPLDRATERAGWAFITPWLIGFLLLALGPMIVSALLSVTRWTAMTPLNEAQYVGNENYRQLFQSDKEFKQSLKVTAKYALLAVPVGQLAALAVALLMNTNVRGITIFRTIYFVPSVISGAALALLWLTIYNDQFGLLNTSLRAVFANPGRIAAILAILLLLACAVIAMIRVAKDDRRPPRKTFIVAGAAVLTALVGLFAWWRGWHIPLRPPNWFGVDTTTSPPTVDAARWAIPAFVLMNLWGVGSGMIIYLAGLKGIPQSYYEAATIDGASSARKLWNVTLPMLSPLIFFNFVMAIIGSFQIFTQAYLMARETPENAGLFYVLNLYEQAFRFHNMGYASAMAWILFLIVLVLTVIVFRGSRRVVYYEGLKA
ncbi:hypothetical protein BH09PLA1_BH09PLA1_16860 [soil metagenome]